MPPTYYRGCWHVVSRGFLVRYRHYRPLRQEFTIRKPSSSTRRRCIRVSPIVQYPPLLPPVGVWAVSQSQCGRSTSQSGYQSSLGGPLPHQLANWTRVHPEANKSFSRCAMRHRGLCGISSRFQLLSPTPAGYSRVTHPFATKLKKASSLKFRSTCMC